MRRLVEKYKLPARWLAPYVDQGALPALPPLPAKVLYLDSYDNYLENWFEDWPNKEMQDMLLDSSFEHDQAAPTLFAGLPEQVRNRLTDRRGKQLCVQVGRMAWMYAPDILQEIAESGAQGIARRFVIDGKEFEGQLLYWPHKYPLCAFRLEHRESPELVYRLEGAAYGITLEQLEGLLEGLVAVNERPELIAQYQSEHDEHRRALEQRMRS